MEIDIGRQTHILRIPAKPADPGFISELRSGASLRAIVIFALLYRIKLIVENDLDSIISGKKLPQEI